MKNKIMKSVGIRIKFYREKRGYSIRALALKMGLKSPSGLSKYENFKASPRIDTLYQIAKVLEISIYDLIEDSEELLDYRTKRITPLELSKENKKIIKNPHLFDDYVD